MKPSHNKTSVQDIMGDGDGGIDPWLATTVILTAVLVLSSLAFCGYALATLEGEALNITLVMLATLTAGPLIGLALQISARRTRRNAANRGGQRYAHDS